MSVLAQLDVSVQVEESTEAPEAPRLDPPGGSLPVTGAAVFSLPAFIALVAAAVVTRLRRRAEARSEELPCVE